MVVICVDVTVGGLLPARVTSNVKDCVATKPSLSVAVRTIEWFPASLLEAVPDSTPVPVLKLSQSGLAVAA